MSEIGLSDLEQALVEAGTDPSRERTLKHQLLQNDLYVAGTQSREAESDGPGMGMVHDNFHGVGYLAAYTSLDRLRSVAPGQPHLVLRGGAVLRSVRPGETLVINLGSWPNRTITYEQAAAMASSWEMVQAQTEVGQPKRYPAPLLEALWLHFHRTAGVEEARLAEVHESGREPRLVICLSADHDTEIERLVDEAREVARFAHPSQVDLQLLGADDLSQHLCREAICFFHRRPAVGRFSSWPSAWAPLFAPHSGV